jgi:hypothetical protein
MKLGEYQNRHFNPCSGSPYQKGRLRAVDLLVLTGSNQLFFFCKTSYHNEEVNCTELMFPVYSLGSILVIHSGHTEAPLAIQTDMLLESGMPTVNKR